MAAFAAGAFALCLSLPARAQDHLRFEARSFKSAAATLPYRLFIPKGYAPTRKYPLVLGLHSGGTRGEDNIIQVDQEDFAKPFLADSVQAANPHFILMPQCPANQNWTTSLDGKGSLTPYGTAVLLLVDSLKREFSLDTARFYLGGFSMGGVATWVFLKNKPDLFAAAFPCSGAGDDAAVAALVKTPFWAFHGDADAIIPTKGTRDMIGAAEKSGTKVVRFVSQAFIAAPAPSAYDEALARGTGVLDLVAKNPSGIGYDSLRRAVAGGADHLYSEIAGGDHRTGWMVAFHHPLLAAWLFSKTKPAHAVSLTRGGGRESRSARGATLPFGGLPRAAGRTFTLQGRVLAVAPAAGREAAAEAPFAGPRLLLDSR